MNDYRYNIALAVEASSNQYRKQNNKKYVGKASLIKSKRHMKLASYLMAASGNFFLSKKFKEAEKGVKK